LLFRSTTDATKQTAIFMKDSARKVGIKLETELLTFPEFLRRQDEGTGQAYDAGWVMDYPDAQNMLQLLYGPLKPPGINSAAYDSEIYNTLYEGLVPLNDSVPEQLDEKIDVIRQMHTQLEKDTPWALFEFRVIYKLYHSWHLPPKPNPFAYTYIKFEYSDSGKRAERAADWEERNYFWALLLSMLIVIPGGLMGYRVLRNR
jgi:ABC-type transport system substrate-binding protein